MLGPQHARLLAFFCFLAVCHVIEADLGGFPAVVAFTAAVAGAAVVAARSAAVVAVAMRAAAVSISVAAVVASASAFAAAARLVAVLVVEPLLLTLLEADQIDVGGVLCWLEGGVMGCWGFRRAVGRRLRGFEG